MMAQIPGIDALLLEAQKLDDTAVTGRSVTCMLEIHCLELGGVVNDTVVNVVVDTVVNVVVDSLVNVVVDNLVNVVVY